LRASHGLRETLLDEIDEVAEVDRHEHVRRRARAFGGYAFGEAIAYEDRIDLDARVLGKGLQQRFH
jgi:hypothetical protein